MKKIIIWVVGVIVLLLVLLFILPTVLGLFAKDISQVNTPGIVFEAKALKDSENSYVDLVKLEKAVNVPKTITTQILNSYIDGSAWNEKDVQDLLSKNSEALNYFTAAAQKSSYQNPDFIDVSKLSADTRLPGLSQIRTAAYLSNIKAQSLLKQGRTNEALDELFKSIKIGNQLDSSQASLIEYLVGISLKGISLKNLEKIINTSNLSLDQMISINARLNQNYDTGVGLKNAFKLEYPLMSSVMDLVQKGNEDYSPDNLIASGTPNFFMKQATRNPKNLFYFKPNKTKQLFADNITRQIALVDEPCVTSLNQNTQNLVLNPSSPTILFTENAIGKMLFDVGNGLSTIYQRRCESNFLISANKTLIAIKAYKNAKGKYPIDWNDLIIEHYIAAIPKDPFDNNSLKYSFEKKAIYSVGKKGVDVGGSEGDLNNLSTMENPTVKIGF